MKPIQAVFLDRDGTIGGTGHFVHPNDFQLYPNSAAALRLLREAGLLVFAFTNQHRIAQGQASVEQFEQQFASYGFHRAYICPHEANDECECRKPLPGMLLQAAADYRVDLTRCVVIGDVGDTDMLAANAVGAMKVIVKTGWGSGSLGPYRERWAGVEPDYVAEDVMDAAEWILRQQADAGPYHRVPGQCGKRCD